VNESPGQIDEQSAAIFPAAVAAKQSTWRLQLVWVVPIVALLIAGWLVVQSVMKSGPTITIRFSTGEGIEAGKTKITHKSGI
jgi:paraquat-inducible protein B